jgi:hypothetical protein
MSLFQKHVHITVEDDELKQVAVETHIGGEGMTMQWNTGTFENPVWSEPIPVAALVERRVVFDADDPQSEVETVRIVR